MNVRKLQGEIDKTLKKVSEGVIEFDAILKKVYAATSSNQKDKYEGDLKKEIKKLQRYRDQIKNWLTNNEVKNKSSLMEYRKLVEQKMEQFKACEKETKTKAYSKEGLGQTPKDNDAKIQVRYWAGKAISSLKSQIESFETDIENIPVRKRKTESSKVESIQKYLEHHRYHLRALELLRRAMENDKIPAEEIEKIKDSVEYYIDNYEDENNEEPEEIYGSFNLKISTTSGDDDLDLSIDESDEDDTALSSDSDNDIDNDDDTAPSSPTGSSSPTTTPSIPTSIPLKTSPIQQTSTTSPNVTSTSNPKNVDRISSPPALNISSTGNQQPISSSTQQNISRNTTPSPTFSSVTKSNIKTTSNAPETKLNQQSTPPSLSSTNTTNLPSTQPINPSIPSNTSPYPPNLQGNLPMAQRLQMHQMAQQQTAAAHIQQQMAQQQQQQQQQFNMRGARNVLQYPLNYQVKDDIDTGSNVKDSMGPLNLLKSNSPPHGSPSPPGIGSIVDDDIKNNETFDTSSNLYPGTLAELSSATMSRIQGEVNGPSIASAGGGASLSGVQDLHQSNKMLSQNYEENLSITRMMMETSFKYVPEFKDYERQQPYLPKNPKQTPNYYPHIPLPIFDQPAIFEKFEIDPLFFIFYFKQGTYQQFLAARELKKQGWRYHKKYLTWFRRHEEPKEITNDYEQGTYVYFDYETGWCQRKKTEFTFEYRFLEE